ncbi:MAG: heat-inducible transcriptional repressor HrcA [Eubacteriales bacterium]|nr:heat-inducible transcriptional repressor HrcA [Eubacteriales bacterium]
MKLDERKERILMAIVDEYVANGQPVASKTLVQSHQFRLSSATLRNEMAALEQAGYLISPHTSAGRVPSDQGYRAYVELLMRGASMQPLRLPWLMDRLRSEVFHLESFVEESNRLLQQETGYIALMTSEPRRDERLEKLRFFMIEPGKILILLVLKGGRLQERLSACHSHLHEKDLRRIQTCFEQAFQGQKLTAIAPQLCWDLLADQGFSVQILESLVSEFIACVGSALKRSRYLDGEFSLLKYPEFQDGHEAQRLYRWISEEGAIEDYVEYEQNRREAEALAFVREHGRRPCLQNAFQSCFVLKIGADLGFTGLDSCSLIASRYGYGRKFSGSIIVLGPKRMDYGQVISRVAYLRLLLNELLDEERLQMEIGEGKTLVRALLATGLSSKR